MSLLFRLLSQLNEKEREYQELLRDSVQRKQEQIDELRTAQATEGKVSFFLIQTVCYINIDSPGTLVVVPGQFDSMCRRSL